MSGEIYFVARTRAVLGARDVTAENNCFASPWQNNENIESLATAGRSIECIFMHSARTRCSGSTARSPMLYERYFHRFSIPLVFRY